MSECGELTFNGFTDDNFLMDNYDYNSMDFCCNVPKEEEIDDTSASPSPNCDADMDCSDGGINYVMSTDLYDILQTDSLFSNLLNDSSDKHEESGPFAIAGSNSAMNGPAANCLDSADDTTNVNSVLNDIETSLINTTVPYGNCGNNNNICNENTGSGGEIDTTFDHMTPTFSMPDLLSSKNEIQMSDVGTALDGNVIQPIGCKTSPTYSWDSGVPADEESSPPSGRLDQQLSPESDYTGTSPSCTDYLTAFNSPQPVCTPLRSPSSSAGSGYCSSSSPSSSPNSSPLPTVATPTHLKPQFSTVPASVVTASTLNVTKISNLNQQSTVTGTTSTPQFYIQKRPFGSNSKFSISKVISNGLSTNIKQPITVVSTNTINNLRLTTTNNNTNSARVTSTIITNNNKSQLSSCGAPTKLVHSKASPSPSVVTLSGVNKTAGIIKSPSVINVNRKHPINTITTTISNNNIISNNTAIITGIQQQKPINIISTSGELVSSNGNITTNNIITSGSSNIITNNGNLYKPIKLSQQGRIISGTTNGHQIVLQTRSGSFTTTGKIIKSQNNIIIPFKGNEKFQQFKVIAASSTGTGSITASASTLRANTLLRSTFVNTNPIRNRINGINTVSSGQGLRSNNVSILKNICMPVSKGMQAMKDGITGLITIPKEEIIDSDEELELHKNNQPLILTDEERKLASKECTKFPSHYPLTRSQERDLKRIRRKLRNKQSAQDSRKRKKEHLDSLLLQLKAKADENGQLQQQLASLEEANKKLVDQLKEFQTMMDSQQAAPTITRSSSHNHSSNGNNRQQHQSTFLLMMVLSIALFVYPSVLPQNKTATELLASVAHRMPPAGNTRSLLEAASAKLSVCHDDDTVDDEIDLDSKSIAALTDHDYAPPFKRGRFSFSLSRDNSLYCMPQLDEQLPSPRKKQLPEGNGGGSLWHDGKHDEDDSKESMFLSPDGGFLVPPNDDTLKLNKSAEPPFKKEADSTTHGLVGNHHHHHHHLDPELATKLSQGVLDTIKRQLSHNWTQQPDVKKPLDALSQSLVVELATRGTKRFREDIELE